MTVTRMVACAVLGVWTGVVSAGCSDDGAPPPVPVADAGMDARVDVLVDATTVDGPRDVPQDVTQDAPTDAGNRVDGTAMPMGDGGLNAATVEALVFSGHCAIPSCHAGDMPTGRMNLEAGHARASLVGVMADGVQCRGTGNVRVVPGDPEGSLLVRKVTDAMPPCGSHMPLGYPALTPDLVDLLRAWVDAGAP